MPPLTHTQGGTPGPWNAREYASPIGSWFIRAASGERIIGGGVPVTEANARLIAASPELLDALRDLSDQCARMNATQHAGLPVPAEAWGDLYQATNAARTILAKINPTP